MEAIDRETERAVRACERAIPATVGGERLVFGFDGYLDRVREVVAQRHGRREYSRLDALGSFGEAVVDSAAADTSLTFEWLGTGTRTGGHTCHLSRAFNRLGFEPVMVGTFGRPPADPFLAEFGDCVLHSVGAPGETDAVEFDDGKLLLTELGDTVELDWETVRSTVGVDTLGAHLDGASLVGAGYWAELPEFAALIDGLREDVWPTLAEPPGHVLIDTGDLRKRGAEGIGAGAGALGRLEEVVPVTVSANRLETAVLAEALGAVENTGDSLADTAAALREHLAVSRVVGHGVDRSVCAAADRTATVAVPRTPEPTLTTGAGDHFNAGLALGLLLGLEAGPAVALGNATAGWFVRNGAPPGYADLQGFLASYLDYFGDGG